MRSKLLKIYAPVMTPRLEYVADVIFNTILGIDYELTTDRRKIGSSPCIIYSDEKVRTEFVIRPAGLLQSSGTEKQEPHAGKEGDMPYIFPVEGGTVPFDVFAASFFMLARYEEYLPFKPDAHGRFPGARSLAYRSGFLHLPVVEIWARYLAGMLVKHYPVLTVRHNDYDSLLTVDVDQPFAYRSRGFLRSVGGFMKGLTGTGATPAARLRTMIGREEDPYDNFRLIEESAKRHGIDVLFFFAVGDQGEYDHNPSFRDHAYSEIIKKYSASGSAGLHPSYKSFGREKLLRTETERYRQVTGQMPDRSRQHWLLLHMPDTYRMFEKAGIRYDYTMGYADEPGFRAGIARPYRFYDIGLEKKTELTAVPFQVMDGALRQYKHLEPGPAIETVKKLVQSVRNVGGLFVSVWHNTSLTERDGWEGWRDVFEATLASQKK